jgi:hypothetical protein
MSTVKRVGWILIGVLIGGLAGSSIAATKAQLPSQSNEMRITSTMVPTPEGTVVFLKDTKSAGCWLLLRHPNGTSVAVAPAEACAVTR